MRLRVLKAIVISSALYGESDRLVTFFSKEEGKITGIAKGVRKLTSRKRGALQIFNAVRFQVTDSHGLGVITEAELVYSNNSLQDELKKMAVAYFLCDVVKKITPEHEPHPEIYDLLFRSLVALHKSKNIRKLKEFFTWEILTEAGFAKLEAHTQNPQRFLEEVLERDLPSVRVGKMIQ